MKKLVLFDFDGTLTKSDTLLEFIKFLRGDFRFYIGFILLSPVLIGYKLKIVPNWFTKEVVMSYFWKGMDSTLFNQKCKEFIDQKIQSLLRPGAVDKITEYKKQGAEIYLISASHENWIQHFAHLQGISFLGTKLEIKDNKITGKLAGFNCFGPEKVTRLKEVVNLEDYDEIHAYGDSSGDKELLEIAQQSFYQPFRN